MSLPGHTEHSRQKPFFASVALAIVKFVLFPPFPLFTLHIIIFIINLKFGAQIIYIYSSIWLHLDPRSALIIYRWWISCVA